MMCYPTLILLFHYFQGSRPYTYKFSFTSTSVIADGQVYWYVGDTKMTAVLKQKTENGVVTYYFEDEIRTAPLNSEVKLVYKRKIVYKFGKTTNQMRSCFPTTTGYKNCETCTSVSDRKCPVLHACQSINSR